MDKQLLEIDATWDEHIPEEAVHQMSKAWCRGWLKADINDLDASF